MHTVIFIAAGKQIGFANFYVLPVIGAQDYSCEPPDILSVEEDKQIGAELEEGAVLGNVRELEWRNL